MTLPDQLLLSDLLRRRVRCDQGLDHGPGLVAWMHPPVHRLLGWISKPSNFAARRMAWRLNQLRGLAELELFVDGPGTETDQAIVDRLPTLIDAALVGDRGQVLGTLADAAVELRSGKILHYLVSRSDPRLPGSSRWRLSPERIVDQQPGRVMAALQGLDDLPLARSSVRQDFLRRSRRWRDQLQEETTRLRDQFQQAGDRFEERLEGWLEEPPWDVEASAAAAPRDPRRDRWGDEQAEAWDQPDWDDALWDGPPAPAPAPEPSQRPAADVWDQSEAPPAGRSRYGGAFDRDDQRHRRAAPPDLDGDDPWV